MRAARKTAYVFGFIVFISFALRSHAAPLPQGDAAKVKIARGEYLSNHTSMCDDCHTLHDDHGAPVKSKHLHGAQITFKSINPLPSSVWADAAPPLAGLTFLSDQEAVVFFTTGKMPDGKLARAPMPGYRFSKSDAEALTAYLKSLPPTPSK